MDGFISSKHSSPSLKGLGSWSKGTGNVTTSRLNAKGDKNWRGKRGGEKKSKGKSAPGMHY